MKFANQLNKRQGNFIATFTITALSTKQTNLYFLPTTYTKKHKFQLTLQQFISSPAECVFPLFLYQIGRNKLQHFKFNLVSYPIASYHCHSSKGSQAIPTSTKLKLYENLGCFSSFHILFSALRSNIKGSNNKSRDTYYYIIHNITRRTTN